MSSSTTMDRVIWCVLLCAGFCVLTSDAVADDVDITRPTKTEAQLKLEEKAREAQRVKEEKEAAAKTRREAKAKAKLEQEVAKLTLPEDTSPRLMVRELQLSGNTLITTDALLEDMPGIYNASDKGLHEAASKDLYDLRPLQDIVLRPGPSREVSSRTIQGFTQYILSVYQDKNYAGIYVYVPSEALKEGRKLEDDVLPIRVLEATVTKVTVTHYTPENEVVEKGYLRTSAVQEWSPVKTGKVANQKKLGDFVNLLNLNPDRYVSAVVSRGVEPESLALGYNIYEANPWHWFVQVDNSGTKDRQWNPRVGLINTNLFGIDDTFTTVYQAPLESDIEDNYSIYGSYDFPLLGPRVRLNLFGGYSEYDINPDTGDIDFLGNGSFYGGTLRFNAVQADGWFFDVTGTLLHQESKVTPSLFPDFLETDLKFDLWGMGVEVHRSDDMTDTSLSFEQLSSFGGSGQDEFTLARIGSERDFTILTTTASHSQYLDPNKVQRFNGFFQWITPDERLAPAQMTTFGGMYSVRGYDEYEIVVDGGILASVQYEFDLVAHEKSMDVYKSESELNEEKKPFVRKLAPLAFLDYGLAKMEDAIAGEDEDEELCSVGVGLAVDLGDNFSGVLYYGYPLIATDNTSVGKGRLNVGLMLRW